MGLIGFGDYIGAAPASVTVLKAEEKTVTGNTTLTTGDAGKSISNRGATTALTVILPDAFSSINQKYEFSKVSAQDLIVATAGTDTIADSIAGGTVKNITATEVFSKLIIESVQTGASTAAWLIKGGFGTWETQSV